MQIKYIGGIYTQNKALVRGHITLSATYLFLQNQSKAVT